MEINVSFWVDSWSVDDTSNWNNDPLIPAGVTIRGLPDTRYGAETAPIIVKGRIGESIAVTAPIIIGIIVSVAVNIPVNLLSQWLYDKFIKKAGKHVTIQGHETPLELKEIERVVREALDVKGS